MMEFDQMVDLFSRHAPRVTLPDVLEFHDALHPERIDEKILQERLGDDVSFQYRRSENVLIVDFALYLKVKCKNCSKIQSWKDKVIVNVTNPEDVVRDAYSGNLSWFEVASPTCTGCGGTFFKVVPRVEITLVDVICTIIEASKFREIVFCNIDGTSDFLLEICEHVDFSGSGFLSLNLQEDLRLEQYEVLKTIVQPLDIVPSEYAQDMEFETSPLDLDDYFPTKELSLEVTPPGIRGFGKIIPRIHDYTPIESFSGSFRLSITY